MKYLNAVNKILGKSYNISDCVMAGTQGSRSEVYHIDNKYTFKVCTRDYKEEKAALERLKGKYFVPKVYGFDDSLNIIVMEKLNGEFFHEYISNHNELPPQLINSWYDIRIEMLNNLCCDYDEKLCELCWSNEQVKKVDYGQTECYTDQKNIKDKFVSDIKILEEERLKLLKNDEDQWEVFARDLMREGVPKDLVKNYKNNFKAK